MNFLTAATSNFLGTLFPLFKNLLAIIEKTHPGRTAESPTWAGENGAISLLPNRRTGRPIEDCGMSISKIYGSRRGRDDFYARVVPTSAPRVISRPHSSCGAGLCVTRLCRGGLWIGTIAVGHHDTVAAPARHGSGLCAAAASRAATSPPPDLPAIGIGWRTCCHCQAIWIVDHALPFARRLGGDHGGVRRGGRVRHLTALAMLVDRFRCADGNKIAVGRERVGRDKDQQQKCQKANSHRASLVRARISWRRLSLSACKVRTASARSSLSALSCFTASINGATS
ncbi:hypothetical protein C7374_12316 [Falsochrobactrum ovis]|uniref:Uncharacterized protein n=1 Tax=Falsochrobactrum ovis TaxID=1293442 RepID=A0A364JRT2_9HYPH|nr:hypothetical protein C7374_12316 [Falsochrobactrum ovis]